MEKSAFFVNQYETFDSFPNSTSKTLMLDTQLLHKNKVEEYKEKIANRRLAEQEAEKKKLEDKERRRIAREAKRKAEEIARLKSSIEDNFIKTGKPEDGILLNDLIDIDGHSQEKPNICVLGGFLGQVMIVLNSIVKHHAWADAGRKTRRPKTP